MSKDLSTQSLVPLAEKEDAYSRYVAAAALEERRERLGAFIRWLPEPTSASRHGGQPGHSGRPSGIKSMP